MNSGTIFKGNSFFREQEYQRALDEYLLARGRMPQLAHIIDPSIERCLKALDSGQGAHDTFAASWPGRDSSAIYKPKAPSSVATKQVRVLFFPDYSATNPYQSLLYSDCPPNIDIRPGNLDMALMDLKANKFTRTIFHLHWVTFVLAGFSEEDAKGRAEKFLINLEEFVNLGGELVWTIHNSLEHDSKYPCIEKNLRMGICRLAMRIHIHSISSIDLIEKDYLLPREKISIIPHGNYLGYYSDICTREAARNYLKIEEDDLVFLSLGQIRPYKGLDTLLHAFSAVRAKSPNARLIIAGTVICPYKVNQIASITNAYQGVSLFPYEISDTELQYFYSASDVVVFSYKRILTSGSVYCALSFGRPVIGPNIPTIAEVVTHGKNGLLFDATNPETGLKNALIQLYSKSRKALVEMQQEAKRGIAPHGWKNAVGDLFWTTKECLQKSIATSNITRSEVFNIELQAVSCEIYEPEKVGEANVAIVILNYENTDDVAELINSINSLKLQDVLVVIVDNCSSQETTATLFTRFPGCVVIRAAENLGYAGGNNVGIRYVQKEKIPYIWILNPDTVLKKNTLSALLKGAEDFPETDIWGPLIAYYDRPDILWFGGGVASLGARCTVGHMFHDKPLNAAPKSPYEVDYVTGASLFCRTEIFRRVGLIPELYFLYFEETDWCARAKREGLKIRVNPDSVLLHKKRSQVGKMPTKYYMYYFVRGAMLFRQRLSTLTIEQSRADILATFVNPWLNRIKQISPEEHQFFERLSNRALEDGALGVFGRKELRTILGSSEWQGKDLNSIIKGVFKVLPDKRIAGWVVNQAQTDEHLRVSVFLDGAFSGYAVCSLADECVALRSEVEPGGHGFIYVLPVDVINGSLHQAEVFAEGVQLLPSPFAATFDRLQPSIKGRLDGVQDRILEGWCLDDNNPQIPVEVELYIGKRLIATTTNDLNRPDVFKVFGKTERSGFSVPVPIEYCDGNEHNFILRAKGESRVINARTFKMDLRKFPLAPSKIGLDEIFQWIFTRRELSFVHSENRSLPALGELEKTRTNLIQKALGCPQDFLVSIIMPVFNRANVVEAAIASINAQSYANWELLICDDGSTDGSAEKVRTLIDQLQLSGRVHLQVLSNNQGVSHARNVALKAAKGDMVAYLDSDNTWDPDYLLVMVNAVREEGFKGSVYCGDRIVQYYKTMGAAEPAPEIVALRFGHLNRTLLENKNYIDLNVFVHSRSLYEQYGGFRADMKRLVDWELIVRYAQVAPVKFIPAILVTYNLDACGNQITRTQDYNENSVKLRHSIENIHKENKEVWDVGVSYSQGREIGRNVNIILLNDGHAINWFSIATQVWLDSACEDAKITIINSAENGTDFGQIRAVSDAISEVNLPESSVLEYIYQVAIGSHGNQSRAIVIASVRAMPPANWFQFCESVERMTPNVGAITSAHMISGSVANSLADVTFKNSRNDFYYDLAPIEFYSSGIRLYLNANYSEAIEVSHPSRFFCYLTNVGVSDITSYMLGCNHSEPFNLAIGDLLQKRGNQVLYFSQLRVLEI